MERREKLATVVKKLAAKFLLREGNGTSLVTVSRATAAPDLKRATVFITVLPEEKEGEALAFAKRKRSEFRDILKKHLKIKNIPFIDFEIDFGEKNRQKIDDLLRDQKV